MDAPKKKSERSKPKKQPKTATGKLLTSKLKELAGDIVTSVLSENGEVRMITRAELLAEEVWDQACGITIDPTNGTRTLNHNPTPWAVQCVLERLDGKVIPRAKDRTNRPSLGKRIDEQQALKLKSLKRD